MWLASVLNIDQNIIQINSNKDIKLLSNNLVDIVLKTGWRIGKARKYNLVFEVVVLGIKNYLPLVTFSNSHLMIGTSQVQLCELLSPT